MEQKSSALKVFMACIGAFVLLIILLIFCLPMLISTSTGKKMLADIVRKKSGFELQIDTLSLSWLGTQNANGIQAQNSSQHVQLTCQEIASDASLLHVLFSKNLGHIKITEGSVEFSPPNLPPIRFEQIDGSLDTMSQNEVAFSLNSTASQQGSNGKIAIQGSASELNSPFPSANFTATLTELPVMGIDQMVALFNPSLNGLIYAAVGEKIDVQSNVKLAQGNFEVNLDARSPNLTAQIATKTENNLISLKNPATFQFSVTPQLLQKLASNQLILTQTALIQGTISQYTCPLPSNSADLLKSAFQATVIAPNPINLCFNGTTLPLSSLNLTASSPSLEKEISMSLSSSAGGGTLAIAGKSENPFSDSKSGTGTINASKFPIDLVAMTLGTSSLSTWLGNTVDLNAVINLTKTNPKLQFSWQSQFLNIPSLDLSLNNPITLNSPAQFTFNINPGLAKTDPIVGTLDQLVIPTDQIKNARLSASVSTGQILFSDVNISKLQAKLDVNSLDPLKGKLSSPEIAFVAQNQTISLQNLNVPFQWDSKSKSAALQLSSNMQNPSGGPGSLQGDFVLSQFSESFQQATLSGTLDVQNISTLLFSAFCPSAQLNLLAGPSLTGKFKLQSTPSQQNVQMKCSSQNLQLDFNCALDNSGLKLQGTSNQLSWVLTPEYYLAIQPKTKGGKVPFEMKEPSTFSMSVSKLFFPVLPKQEIKTFADRFPSIALDLSKLQLNVSGRNPKLSFLDNASNETIQLSNLSFAVNKAGNTSPLTASLDSGVMTLAGTSTAPTSVKNGSLSLTGTLEQSTNAQGAFDLTQLAGSLQMKIQQFPSRAFDILAKAQGRSDSPFTALFGEMINATLSTELKNFSGPIALNVNTPRTRIDLNGALVNGAMMLKDTFYIQMKVTPEMSRLLLKEVNPLNLSYFYSESLVSAAIPANGVYVPLYPSNLAKMAIPQARIELGKISCNNEGNVNIALGLLKSKQSGELPLWFAPIDFKIKQGVVDIERTEILLANNFDVCTWGKIDLPKDYVDMVLGITADTLQKAFGIKGLPENYVLTIPMKGPTNNVQINSSKATAKVALLLAWQNKMISGALKSQGPAGAIVGELMGKMATLPDADAKVPPAKHPFPWEVGKVKKTSNSSNEKKRQFKANEKPLKQILKVIR